MGIFLSSDPFCLPLATPTTNLCKDPDLCNKFQNTRARNSCDQTITGPHHLSLPPTQAGCVLLTHSSSKQVGNAVSSSSITMASLLSSIVMCVALGIPSPSKNPSLVNSSWAAGEQLGSLSAFASGTKKESNEDAPLGSWGITSGCVHTPAACLEPLCILTKCTEFDNRACPLAVRSN